MSRIWRSFPLFGDNVDEHRSSSPLVCTLYAPSLDRHHCRPVQCSAWVVRLFVICTTSTKYFSIIWSVSCVRSTWTWVRDTLRKCMHGNPSSLTYVFKIATPTTNTANKHLSTDSLFMQEPWTMSNFKQATEQQGSTRTYIEIEVAPGTMTTYNKNSQSLPVQRRDDLNFGAALRLLRFSLSHFFSVLTE